MSERTTATRSAQTRCNCSIAMPARICLAHLVLRWTGFRVSDAVTVTFEQITSLTEEINRVAIKNKKSLNVPIRTGLLPLIEAERRRRNAKPSNCVLINPYTGKPFSTHCLYRHIVRLGKRAGVVHVHPHRYRHTFIVDLLLKGLSFYQVGQLVGDTEDTIRRHYAKFTKEFRDMARHAIDSPGGLGDGSPEPDGGADAATPSSVVALPVRHPFALPLSLAPEAQNPSTKMGRAGDERQQPTEKPEARRNSGTRRRRLSDQQQSLWPPDAEGDATSASQSPNEIRQVIANG